MGAHSTGKGAAALSAEAAAFKNVNLPRLVSWGERNGSLVFLPRPSFVNAGCYAQYRRWLIGLRWRESRRRRLNPRSPFINEQTLMANPRTRNLATKFEQEENFFWSLNRELFSRTSLKILSSPQSAKPPPVQEITVHRQNKLRRAIRLLAISSKAADISPNEYSWRKYDQKLRPLSSASTLWRRMLSDSRCPMKPANEDSSACRSDGHQQFTNRLIKEMQRLLSNQVKHSNFSNVRNVDAFQKLLSRYYFLVATETTSLYNYKGNVCVQLTPQTPTCWEYTGCYRRQYEFMSKICLLMQLSFEFALWYEYDELNIDCYTLLTLQTQYEVSWKNHLCLVIFDRIQGTFML